MIKGGFSEIEAPDPPPNPSQVAEYGDIQRQADADNRRDMERRKQELGVIGKWFGNSARDIILGSVIIIGAFVIHALSPDHSVLLPTITGVLGYLAGLRTESKR